MQKLIATRLHGHWKSYYGVVSEIIISKGEILLKNNNDVMKHVLKQNVKLNYYEYVYFIFNWSHHT